MNIENLRCVSLTSQSVYFLDMARSLILCSCVISKCENSHFRKAKWSESIVSAWQVHFKKLYLIFVVHSGSMRFFVGGKISFDMSKVLSRFYCLRFYRIRQVP